mmetsp:Transcript_13809/g.27261  ORF Transcript_13809/g.27261 Transcript_13809/m.27261 type:complete len:256 (+) Transcript_13809:586-1353(+)
MQNAPGALLKASAQSSSGHAADQPTLRSILFHGPEAPNGNAPFVGRRLQQESLHRFGALPCCSPWCLQELAACPPPWHRTGVSLHPERQTLIPILKAFQPGSPAAAQHPSWHQMNSAMPAPCPLAFSAAHIDVRCSLSLKVSQTGGASHLSIAPPPGRNHSQEQPQSRHLCSIPAMGAAHILQCSAGALPPQDRKVHCWLQVAYPEASGTNPRLQLPGRTWDFVRTVVPFAARAFQCSLAGLGIPSHASLLAHPR